MVMLAEPILRAVTDVAKKSRDKRKKVIILSAKGKQFTQADAKRLAKYDMLIFICGRYEGVDARVEKFIDEKISIGNYVVTGGELPAAVVIDAVARMVSGVVGKQESVENESHTSEGYLEHNHYTRPEVLVWKGKKYRAPKILLGGNHKDIGEWRKNKAK